MKKDYYIVADFESCEKLAQTCEKEAEDPLPLGTPKKFPWIQFPSQQAHAVDCKTCTLSKGCSKIMLATENRCCLEAFSYAYQVVSEEENPPKCYMGPNPTEHFLAAMKDECTKIDEKLRYNHPMIMSEEQKTAHEKANSCFICQKPFTSKDIKVADHHHR